MKHGKNIDLIRFDVINYSKWMFNYFANLFDIKFRYLFARERKVCNLL